MGQWSGIGGYVIISDRKGKMLIEISIDNCDLPISIGNLIAA